MCGRYQLDIEQQSSFLSRFDVDEIPTSEMKSSWNVAPSQIEPVVLSHSPNHIEMMQWGLIPFWEEKNVKPKGLINLRDDTILTKKWAHKYLQFQRCIVPATGFYEWKKTTDGKIPYSIRLKSKDYFGMAGLYSSYKHPKTGEEIMNYAIITTSPNELMSQIHNRMPVILKKDDEKEWLNHDLVEIEHIAKLLKPYPEKEMESFPVSTRVNSPSFNDSLLIKPQPKENPSKFQSTPPNSK